MKGPHHERGKITVTTMYEFLCALCDFEDYMAYVSDMNEAEKVMRSSGWSKTVKHGWVCPWCAEKRKTGA